jgi:outer membrane scaffolding protein for murein synthesis (MipA/OmpV family)
MNPKKLLILSTLLAINLVTAAPNQPTPSKTQPSMPLGFIYGAGVSYQQQIYKGFGQRTIALPLLGYVGERLNIFGPFMSYSLVKKDDWILDVNLSPRFSGFDEDDSVFFSGMKNRKDSADAGVSVKYSPNDWSFKFKALTDVLSKSSGTELELSLAKSYRINGFSIEPSISMNHQNDNLVDYYYGVRSSEASLERNFYQASSTVNKNLNLSISKPLDVGLLRLDLTHTWYGSEITNSPLVDADSTLGARLFFITYF